MVDKAGEPIVLSVAEFLASSLRGTARLAALARQSLLETLAPLRGAGYAGPVDCCLGRAEPRPGAAGTELPELRELVGRVGQWQMVSRGHASGLIALETAARWVQSGQSEFALAGGVDSYYDPDVLEWLDRAKRLHSNANPDGFIPGEGSGFCLVTTPSSAARYSRPTFASLISTACDEEPNPLLSDGVCVAQGLTSVMRRALDSAQVPGKIADWTLCDMNGENFRAMEWTQAYLRTGSLHADPLELWHPADCYGDIGAASGPVLTAIAIAAWRRKYARGPRALIWASSDHKDRAAVVLRQGSVN